MLLALAYYAILVTIIRWGESGSGATTFDLVILITMSVVLQATALREGVLNALVFVATVFGLHQLLAMASAQSARIRRLNRGSPRPLKRDGHVDHEALTSEGLSYKELLAGLLRSARRP